MDNKNKYWLIRRTPAMKIIDDEERIHVNGIPFEDLNDILYEVTMCLRDGFSTDDICRWLLRKRQCRGLAAVRRELI